MPDSVRHAVDNTWFLAVARLAMILTPVVVGWALYLYSAEVQWERTTRAAEVSEQRAAQRGLMADIAAASDAIDDVDRAIGIIKATLDEGIRQTLASQERRIVQLEAWQDRMREIGVRRAGDGGP